jgi:glycosyltransferase involved in cell wall biosynthesis
MGVGRNFRVVPNGFDIPESKAGGEERPPLAEPYILYLGYLDPRKQPEFLVQAFARCEARRTHKLILAGSDSYGHAGVVSRVIDRNQLNDRVIFWGPAYGQEKWTLLHHASCLGLPSKGEGVPLILCDALGAGLPSVYSAACNFPEIAERGGGIEISDGSVEAWANALDHVCLNQAVRRALHAAARELGKDYTWEAATDKWIQIYDEVLEARKI